MYRRPFYYIQSPDEPMTIEKLQYWLQQHTVDCKRLQYLKDLYEGRHRIQLQPKKEQWKPDNSIICNC